MLPLPNTTMHNLKLTRLCLILPDDDSDDGHRRVSSGKTSALPLWKSAKRRKRFRRWLAAFVRRLKLKWVDYCRHPAAGAAVVPKSQLFKDTDGVTLVSNRVHRHAPRIFSYSELYIGSSGFSDEEVLGSGGFGRVYRAVLPSDSTVVAVKCVADKAVKMEKTFLAELAAVAQLRHRNLVPLRGWCVHEDQLLLVYEYMPNRSLDRILFKGGSSDPFPWDRRQKIVFGLAAALFYLHEQLDTQIIHRDVKTSNVMLDSNFDARLGDFGLARWLEHDLKSASKRSTGYQFRLADTSHIGGTIGYLPPESFTRSRSGTSAKSDVFSFGVVVLEVASGRRAVDLSQRDDQIILLDWVRTLSDRGNILQAADARLPDGSYSLSDIDRTIHLGLLCTVNDPKARPTMRWIMEALTNELTGDLPALPTFKAHPRYITLSSSSSSSSSGAAAVTISVYNTATGKTIYLTADAGTSAGEDSDEDESENGGLSTSTLSDPVFPAVDAPREIPYREILEATKQFSEEQMVAEMDFGTAYHGYLEDGQRVVIKRLGMKTCPALRARFSDELRNLGSLRHRNLVQLRGWCTEQGEMLVVYDYLPHRSLSHILFSGSGGGGGGGKGGTKLEWGERYGIVKAMASAVLYLHEEWEEQVIHRSITSSSIILDPDKNPKLGSFALAEFLTRNADGHHRASTNDGPRGIFGYMSPEYMESGAAMAAADVYSFGVVVLELVSGQRAVDLRRPEVLLVRKIRDREGRRRPVEELIDPRLGGAYDKVEAERLLRLGLVCTRSDPALRPNMGQVVSVLDGKDRILRRAVDGGVRSAEEKREEWERRNDSALALVKRIQALGIH